MIPDDLLPSTWSTVPLRRVLHKLSRPVHSTDEVVTAYRDGRVMARSIRREEGYTLSDLEAGYQGVEPGDFVFHALDGFAGAVGVSDTRGKCSPVYHICSTMPDYDPRFYVYVLRAMSSLGFLEVQAGNVRQRSVDFRTWDMFARLPVPLPPPFQQSQIADFLDTQTARIDALVIKKRQLAKLAAERFQSTIDFATGLGRPVAVRRVTSLITSGPRGWSDRVGDEGHPFIRSANLRRDRIDLRSDNLQRVAEVISAEASRSRTRVGDTVIGITGANTGWVGLVDSNHASGYVSQHVALLRPSSVLPEWLAFGLRGRRVQEQLAAGQYGGTKQQLGLNDLADASICVPSHDEQLELIEFLQEASDHNTRVATLLTRQIELLQEHRQALITAAVTGNLDATAVALRLRQGSSVCLSSGS